MASIDKGAEFLDARCASDEVEPAVQTHDGEGKPRSQASVLTDIGASHDLFHDPGLDAFAKVRVGTHHEVYRVGSAEYRDVLSRAFYQLTGKGPSRNAVSDAISTLTAMAKFDRTEHPVFRRVGLVEDDLVLDVGDTAWSSFVIRRNGWEMQPNQPVRFLRRGKPLALPTPTVADFQPMWRYVNVRPADRVLVAAWMLAALRPRGPYPILLLVGEQGTGKSTTTRRIKTITDPSAAPLRAPPKDEKDLIVAAISSWVLALDNLSGASPQLSDTLCRLSTGGAHSARRLYSDDDEVLIDIQRPVILNGIDDLASRPDLAERCIHLELPVITERRSESDLERQFQVDAGGIMAAVLDGLSLAMRNAGKVKINNLPRMADFALWAIAGLPALGFDADEFLTAYRANQTNAIHAGLESAAIARALTKFMSVHPEWTGSSNDLLHLLVQHAEDSDRNLPSWPRSPKGLLTTLRRLGPSLRHLGIKYETTRDSTGRYLKLSCKPPGQVSQASSRHSKAGTDDGMTRMTHDQPESIESVEVPL